MKTIQISFPDNYYTAIKEFVEAIPNSTIEEEFELSDDQHLFLKKRSAMPLNNYMTIEEANAKLKTKYV